MLYALYALYDRWRGGMYGRDGWNFFFLEKNLLTPLSLLFCFLAGACDFRWPSRGNKKTKSEFVHYYFHCCCCYVCCVFFRFGA